MKRVLVTGLSGTGKSTLLRDLAGFGFTCVDTDCDGYCGPAELAESLGYVDTVLPLLRQGATLEVDTSAPLADVVATVLAHIGERHGPELLVR